VGGRAKECASHRGTAGLRLESAFGEQTLEESPALTLRPGLPLKAKPARKPVPQGYKQLRAPAPQTPPALRIDHDPHTLADLALAAAFQEVEAKRFQDGTSGVPPARVQVI